MASFRTPKGTVVRAVPDWNSANVANYVGGSVEGPAAFAENGVFNNANDGSFLAIWDATISLIDLNTADGPDLFSGFSLYQATSPATGNGSPPINPTFGMPWGIGFFNAVPDAMGPETQFGPQFRGPATWSWPHNWPMCFVPSGWIFSFQFNTAASSTGECGVSIYWEATKAT